MDPGNGVMSVTNRSRELMRVEKDPKKEVIGMRIARFSLAYAFFTLLVLMPLGCRNGYADLGKTVDTILTNVCGWLILGGLVMIPLGRIISNAFTRDEEFVAYKAVQIYFVGFILYIGVFVFFDVVMLF